MPERFAKLSCNKDILGMPENAMAIAGLIDTVGNLHLMIEIYSEKPAEEQKTSEQELKELAEMQQEMLKKLEQDGIDKEIEEVLKTFHQKVRPLAKLITAKIKNNYEETVKEVTRLLTPPSSGLSLQA